MKFPGTLGLAFHLLLLIDRNSAAVSPRDRRMAKELSFPFFENEFQFPDNSFEINIAELNGFLNISKTIIKGLNTLLIKAEFDSKTGMTSSSLVSDSTVAVSGYYNLSFTGKTPNGFDLSILGNGSHSNSIRNVNIGHVAVVKNGSNRYMEVSDLAIKISFDTISLNFENFSINGFNIDWIWNPLNRFLNTTFKELYSEIQEPLAKIFTERLNTVLKEQGITLKKFTRKVKEFS